VSEFCSAEPIPNAQKSDTRARLVGAQLAATALVLVAGAA